MNLQKKAMALIKCTECGKEFSDKASQCPNCGCPTNEIVENSSVSDAATDSASISNNEESKTEQDTKELYQEAIKCERSGEIETAFELISKGAELNDIDCIAQLGYYYMVGQGVDLDYKKAVNYLSKAANEGNMYAQYNLGICYSNGFGVGQNPELANKWLKKAAEQGHIEAQNAVNPQINYAFLILGLIVFAGAVIGYHETLDMFKGRLETIFALIVGLLGGCFCIYRAFNSQA